MTEFSLEKREHIELCDLLKITGLCSSGGVAKHLIADGQVTVDGEVELRKRCKICSGKIIIYKGHKITVIK